MRAAALVLISVLGTIGQAATAAPDQTLVKARLIADVSAIQPGVPFTIGVMLDIEPGWHIYWLNPGDSGLATSVRLRLPEGFTADAVRFPVPSRSQLPGEEVLFGYDNQVLLTATVHPSSALKPGAQLTLSADVAWLSCQKTCIPGSAKPQLTLRVAEHAVQNNHALFTDWAAKVPAPAEKSPDVAHLSQPASPAGAGRLNVGKNSIEMEWKDTVSSVELFPGPNEAIVVKDITIRPLEGHRTMIDFDAQLLPGVPAGSDRWLLVIAYTDRAGNRRAVSTELAVGLSPTTKAAPRRTER